MDKNELKLILGDKFDTFDILEDELMGICVVALKDSLKLIDYIHSYGDIVLGGDVYECRQEILIDIPEFNWYAKFSKYNTYIENQGHAYAKAVEFYSNLTLSKENFYTDIVFSDELWFRNQAI